MKPRAMPSPCGEMAKTRHRTGTGRGRASRRREAGELRSRDAREVQHRERSLPAVSRTMRPQPPDRPSDQEPSDHVGGIVDAHIHPDAATDIPSPASRSSTPPQPRSRRRRREGGEHGRWLLGHDDALGRPTSRRVPRRRPIRARAVGHLLEPLPASHATPRRRTRSPPLGACPEREDARRSGCRPDRTELGHPGEEAIRPLPAVAVPLAEQLRVDLATFFPDDQRRSTVRRPMMAVPRKTFRSFMAGRYMRPSRRRTRRARPRGRRPPCTGTSTRRCRGRSRRAHPRRFDDQWVVLAVLAVLILFFVLQNRDEANVASCSGMRLRLWVALLFATLPGSSPACSSPHHEGEAPRPLAA